MCFAGEGGGKGLLKTPRFTLFGVRLADFALDGVPLTDLTFVGVPLVEFPLSEFTLARPNGDNHHNGEALYGDFEGNGVLLPFLPFVTTPSLFSSMPNLLDTLISVFLSSAISSAPLQ